MSLHDFVHCHVCPLKETCGFSKPDASWRWQTNGKKRFSDKSDSWILVESQPQDLADLKKATNNCPLRKAVAYTETLQAADLIGKIRSPKK
jgi:ferredoxin